jgi:hypothetical protein
LLPYRLPGEEFASHVPIQPLTSPSGTNFDNLNRGSPTTAHGASRRSDAAAKNDEVCLHTPFGISGGIGFFPFRKKNGYATSSGVSSDQLKDLPERIAHWLLQVRKVSSNLQ